MPPCLKSVVSLVTLTAALSGCGSEKELAPVRGTVTCNGEPLPGGTIVFTPTGDGKESGKAAMGMVQLDGSFVLSTYAENDGAVVGMHTVMYSPPAEQGEGEGEESEDRVALATLPLPAGHPCAFGGTTAEPVEVTSGDNEIDIELTGLSASGEAESDSGEGE